MFIRTLSLVILLLGLMHCSNDLASSRSIAEAYCHQHPETCWNFIPQRTRAEVRDREEVRQTEFCNSAGDEDRETFNRRIDQLRLVMEEIAAEQADRTFRRRSERTLIQRLDRLNQPLEETRITYMAFLALMNADASLEQYARMRRTICTDRTGRRYYFTRYPLARDIARGVTCHLPNDDRALTRLIPNIFFGYRSGSTAERELWDSMLALEAYPEPCGALSRNTIPDPATCRPTTTTP